METAASDTAVRSPGMLISRGKSGKKQVFKSMKNVLGRQRSFWLDGGSSNSSKAHPGRIRRDFTTPDEASSSSKSHLAKSRTQLPDSALPSTSPPTSPPGTQVDTASPDTTSDIDQIQQRARGEKQLSPKARRRHQFWSALASEDFARGFLTGRFAAATSSYWQLLTWIMQAALAAISMAGIQTLNHRYEVQVGTPSTAGDEILLWVRCLGACIVVLGMWTLHTLREPYEYAFQHVASSYSYASNVLLLCIGLFYGTRGGDLRGYEIRSVSTLC